MFKTINNEKGIALIIAMSVLVLMTLLGTAALYTSTLDVTISGNEKSSLQAYYAAMAGIRDAERRLMLNTADTRGATSPAYDKTSPTWAAPVTGTLPNGGSYDVSISHVRNEAGNAVVTESGYGFPYYRITSTGTYGASQRRAEKIIYLTFTNIWGKAVTACGDLVIDSNSGTDSYDSGVGAYDAGTATSDGDIISGGNVTLGVNALFRGDITAKLDVTLGNNSNIAGNVKAGQRIVNGGTISGDATAVTTINNTKTITGSATAGQAITNTGTITGGMNPNSSVAAVNIPPACETANKLKVPGNISTSNNNAAITCTGCSASCTETTPTTPCTVNSNKTMTLPGGTADAPLKYYFNGLDLKSNAQIVANGYVEVYVNGDMTFNSNNIVRESDAANPKPDKILLYGYGASNANPGIASTVDLKSNVELYAKLYAPDASKTIINSDSQVYGAVIAGGMCQACGGGGGIDANAGVSYDQGLENSTTSKIASEAKVERLRECFYGTYSISEGAYYRYSCKPK